MNSVSEEKRQAIVAAYLAGVPTTQIAKQFGVSESYPSQLAGRLQLRRRNLANCGKRGPNRNPRRTVIADAPVEDIAEPVEHATMHGDETAEIRRLARIGRRRTEIAALLRCPHRVVDEALS